MGLVVAPRLPLACPVPFHITRPMLSPHARRIGSSVPSMFRLSAFVLRHACLVNLASRLTLGFCLCVRTSRSHHSRDTAPLGAPLSCVEQPSSRSLWLPHSLLKLSRKLWPSPFTSRRDDQEDLCRAGERFKFVEAQQETLAIAVHIPRDRRDDQEDLCRAGQRFMKTRKAK